MAVDPVGIFGAVLILFAWMLETRKIIKSKDVEGIDIRFLLIYLAGSLTLAYYAVKISDTVFVALSAVISFLTLIEIVFIFIKKSKPRRVQTGKNQA